VDDRGNPAHAGPAATVILPTFNERGTIGELVEELLRTSDAVDVLIVDDNSPDGTGEIAERVCLGNPRVSVIHRAGKLGLGSAYIEGFRRALARGASRVVTMDADYSHHPRHLNALVAATEKFDISIGSRYARAGGVAADWGWHRKLLSRGANAFTRRALGFDTRDCTSGFRCYRREVLESIDWSRVRSSGYSFLVETLYVARSRGFSVGEVPILFESRTRGRSKIGIGEVFKAVYTVARLHRLRAPIEPLIENRNNSRVPPGRIPGDPAQRPPPGGGPGSAETNSSKKSRAGA